MNIGDIIYQLFTILAPVVFIILIVLYVRNTKKHNDRLKRIEEKVDNLKNDK
ncbi:hypothetical protein [Bacillus sp. 03113]|uniref:hypothetical protein n=1 Tax=Bacillus sp. 03113 TaxID=2578211 RepID=UPI0015E8976B|nr:hypothetical protein [Bacillus sp. 03113]